MVSTPADEPLRTSGLSQELSQKLDYFGQMIPRCLEHARSAQAQGRPIVGMMCEFTPRELIMAAGAVPVCMCGGSSRTVPAAEPDLPSNLCPLIKSTYGYRMLRSNPFMEMADLIVAETTCDGKKKMYELLGQTRPMYVIELSQKAESVHSLKFWENELRRFRLFLQERFNVEVTDDSIREAIRVMNRERQLRRQLAQVMQANDPPITGRQLLDCRSIISGMAEDFTHYQKLFDHLKTQPGGGYGGRTRVLLTGVPVPHGAERVVEIIENNGGLIVCFENCSGLKPILEDVDEQIQDPIAALAVKYFQVPCSVMTQNDRRMEMIRSMVRQYRPHCVIDLVWHACLTYDIESTRLRRVVEEELGLPYLRIDTDYSPSDSARIATRVAALFESTRSRGSSPMINTRTPFSS